MGKRLVEDCLALDLARLMRLGPICDGMAAHGEFLWSIDGAKIGAVRFRLDLRFPEAATLDLNFQVTPGNGGTRKISQRVFLCSTRPNFGGRRWWMRCPISGKRVRVLYLLPGEEKFAGRSALNLSYRIERVSQFDRPFEKMFRAQRKLGAPQCLGATIERPKGMWRRTFARRSAELDKLDLECAERICATIR